MTWIRLDPNELGAVGAHLRDVSAALIDSAARVRTACCLPGLGRYAGPLMAEGETVAMQTVAVTEGYLRLGIDILQRAIIAVRDGQLVSAVGNVGAGIVAASVVGGGGPAFVGGLVLGSATPTTSVIGGSATIGGLVLGDATPMTSVIGGSATIGGLVLGSATPMTSVIGGSATIGGTVMGGGGAMAGGVMALAQAGQNSQNRQTAILDRLRAQGGLTAPAGNQALGDYFTRQALDRIRDSEIRTAANSPIAGYPQAQAADATDFGGRVRALDNERFYERKRLGLT